mgnify:CR=1 FL=1
MANPNPSPETRFKEGNKSSGGKTSEQRRLEYEAAEMAANLRHAMLSDMTERVRKAIEDDPDAAGTALSLLGSDTLRLMKDSEDRAHGTPTSTQEISGPDGGPISFEKMHLAPLEADEPND